MVDLHTHILPGVDDGADDLEESLEIAREAERQGVTQIVATSHYLEEGYCLSPAETKERVDNLQMEIDKLDIDVEILTGAEVYLTADLAKKVDDGMVPTINNSQYILIELPMRRVPDYTEAVLHDLQVMGYTPIIAHPERYTEVMSNPALLHQWLEDGVLAQLNAGSLLGMFGSKVKETAEILVEYNLVQVFASDLHSNNRRRECLQEGVRRLTELIGKKADTYLANAKLIVENQEVVAHPRCYHKPKGFFGKLFGQLIVNS